MKHGIYWLASYPKSGNTWTRAVLTNYMLDGDAPADINALAMDSIASSRTDFDELLCLPSSDMNEEQIRLLQPLVYEALAGNASRDLFIKVHDAYTFNSRGEPLFSPSLTKGVLYLVRNPFDVAVSFAHHDAISIEEAVQNLNRRDYTMARSIGCWNNQLPQWLLDWSSHAASWLESGLPLHVARYEEMLERPYETFYGILNFLGFEMDSARLEKALRFSRFDVLKRQEESRGFGEKNPRAQNFFREGRAGGYRHRLSADQIERITAQHSAMLKRFGYL